jgi:hypothetical protein
MTTRMRTAGRIAAAAALTLLLAGCVRVDMDLDVAADDTVSGSAVLAVDEGLLSLSGQSADELFRQLPVSDLPPGTSVDPYEEDGFVGQEFTFEAIPISEFSSDQTLGGAGDPLSITRVGDEFRVSGNLDMSSSEFQGQQVPQQFLESFEFRIAITFPGPVTSATGTIDGNTVTWEPRVGENTPIRAVASAIPSGTPIALIVLIVAVVAAVALIAYLLFSRRRVAPVPAGGDAWSEPATDTGEPEPAATGGPAEPVPSPEVAEDEPRDRGAPPPVPPVSG